MKQLEARPDVDVIAIRPRGYAILSTDTWSDWVDLLVAPTTGIYSVKGLQDFMLGLTTIVPTMRDDFHGGDHHMGFGKLYFDEPVGTTTTTGTQTVTITDADVPHPAGFTNGEVVDTTSTKMLMRRTLVRVYPDQTCAQREVNGTDIFGMNNPVPQNVPDNRRRHTLWNIFSR